MIPGLGRSPGEGKGYPLQYSGLENSMHCIVHGVAKIRTRLSDFHCHFLVSHRVYTPRRYRGLAPSRHGWIWQPQNCHYTSTLLSSRFLPRPQGWTCDPGLAKWRIVTP